MNAGGFAPDLDPVISSSQLIRRRGDIVATVQRLAIFEFPIKLFAAACVFMWNVSHLTGHFLSARDTAIFSLHRCVRKRRRLL